MQRQQQLSRMVILTPWRPHTMAHHTHNSTAGFCKPPCPLMSTNLWGTKTPPYHALQQRHSWCTKTFAVVTGQNQLHTTALVCDANTDRRILQGWISQLTDLQLRHWLSNLLKFSSWKWQRKTVQSSFSMAIVHLHCLLFLYKQIIGCYYCLQDIV